MLKLKLKPTNELGLQEIQYYNLSVSPDLSRISGRTSNYNSLLNGELVKVVNNENNFINRCKVDTENIKVQGRVLLEITLPIKTVTKGLLLPPITSITLSTNVVIIKPTIKTFQLSCTTYPIEGTNKEVHWFTSDENIASVDSNGLVSFKSVTGEVIITAASPDGTVKDACKIIITNEEREVIHVTGITISSGASPYYSSIDIVTDTEHNFQINVKVEPSNADFSGYNVSYNNAMISYNDSVFTALDSGETTIVFSTYDKKFKAFCNVKINGQKKAEKTDYKLTEVTKNYVEYNGAFSYDYNGSYLVDGKVYTADSTTSTVTISTFSYIEDGKVMIGDKEYYADFRGGEGKPDIKENKYATALNEGDNVTPFIKYMGVQKYHPNYWTRETKFNIWKDENETLDVETTLYGAYEHYIDYEGERYYLKNMYDESKTYKGYGVEINGQYYSDITRSTYDGEISVPNDYGESFAGSLISISDDNVDIQDTLVSPKNGGRLLFLITKSEKLDLKPGNIIVAKSNGAIESKIRVQNDENNSYITYLGKKYDVIDKYYRYIIVGNEEYKLTDDSDGTYAVIDGNKIYYTIDDSGNATPVNKIYYSLESELDKKSGGTDSVLYGIYEKGYKTSTTSGISIDNEDYRVYNDGINPNYSYVTIYEDVEYSLVVSEKTGSSTYLCYPYVDTTEIINNEDAANIQRRVCDVLVWNNDKFTYQVRNDIFGEKKIYSDTYLYEAAISTKPFCTTDVLNLSIFKINKYINLKLPIVNGVPNNIMVDDVSKSILSQDVIEKNKTKVVDMEKDIYYPVWQDSGGTFNPITNIRFNLHFRTRQLDNWKVIEDYNEDTDKDSCNWVITDYKYYQNALPIGGTDGNPTLQSASDLIGFMNFTTSEVKNLSNKISKSFLRLSFYSTDNPQTQVLLATSTIFMDENELLQKYMSGQKGSKIGSFEKTKFYQIGVNYKSNYIGDDTEYDNPIYGPYRFDENEPLRLSSRLNVYDKHISKSSSEGFYFYMFKEYANNLRPLTIYLKIDFNHAGIGRTIQFMLPRKNEDGVDKPLLLHKLNDLNILKQGFTLKDIYKQIYIPINVIYDDKTNRYVYYLPEDLRINQYLLNQHGEQYVDDNIMEFDLFEVKFKDESVNRDNESNQ